MPRNQRESCQINRIRRKKECTIFRGEELIGAVKRHKCRPWHHACSFRLKNGSYTTLERQWEQFYRVHDSQNQELSEVTGDFQKNFKSFQGCARENVLVLKMLSSLLLHILQFYSTIAWKSKFIMYRWCNLAFRKSPWSKRKERLLSTFGQCSKFKNISLIFEDKCKHIHRLFEASRTLVLHLCLQFHRISQFYVFFEGVSF